MSAAPAASRRTRTHTYGTTVRWTGNRGAGTASYGDYGRDHVIEADGRPPIPGSSDPQFRGDADRYSPEDLLVASLSGCHMLWYLHLCADAGIVVEDYVDSAVGEMVEEAGGAGQFTRVELRPTVTVAAGSDAALAAALHNQAHELCFIARSVRFPVECQPQTMVAAPE